MGLVGATFRGGGNSKHICASWGLDCSCVKPSGHRRALGHARSIAHLATPRRTPAVAVSVSIEETSSAHSKFDVLLSCLGGTAFSHLLGVLAMSTADHTRKQLTLPHSLTRLHMLAESCGCAQVSKW